MCRDCYRHLISTLEELIFEWRPCCEGCKKQRKMYVSIHLLLITLNASTKKKDFHHLISKIKAKMNEILDSVTEGVALGKNSEHRLLDEADFLKKMNEDLTAVEEESEDWNLVE